MDTSSSSSSSIQPPPSKQHRRSLSHHKFSSPSSSTSPTMTSSSSANGFPAPPPPLPSATRGYHFPPPPPPLFNGDPQSQLSTTMPALPPPLPQTYSSSAAANQDFVMRSNSGSHPGKFQPSASLPPPSPSSSPSPSPYHFGAHDRERASSYNATKQPSDQKIKRRSRSFTDLSEIGKQQLQQQQFNPSFNFVYPGFQPFQGLPPMPMQPVQPMQPFQNAASVPFGWQPVPLSMLPPLPMVNGKVAISRAPEGISGKPVHIVTQQEKKQAHSAMERRYRKELNSQISLLKEIVPTCRNHPGANINKVLILKKTVDYVKSLRLKENELINPTRVEDPEIFLAAPDLGENTAMAERIVAQRILIDQQQQIIEHLSRDFLLLMRGESDKEQEEEADYETPEYLARGQSEGLEDYSEGNSHFATADATTTTTLLNDQLSSPLSHMHDQHHYQGPHLHHQVGSGFDAVSFAVPQTMHRGQRLEGDITNIRNEFGNVALTEQQLRGLP